MIDPVAIIALPIGLTILVLVLLYAFKRNNRSLWKRMGCFTVLLIVLIVFSAGATGWPMLLFDPFASSNVEIDAKDLDQWKAELRRISSERSGWFSDRSLEGHIGATTEGYTWHQFGYCSLVECLVLTNSFKPNEFRIQAYESKLARNGGDLQSYLKAKGIDLVRQ